MKTRRWSRFAIFAATASLASAQVPPPACAPNEGGCSRAYSAIENGVLHILWFEPVGDEWSPAGFSARPQDLPSNWFDLLYGAAAQREALWRELVTRALEPAESSALAKLEVHRPPSPYAVPPARDAETRPTYPVVNGFRGLRSNGRVAIGAPCYPSVWQAGSYAAITKIEPLSVAVCAKR